MRRKRPAKHITRLLLLAVVITSNCWLTGGCMPHNSPSIVVLDSDRVILVNQGETVVAPWPAVLISRGRYLRLIDAEMAITENDGVTHR